MKPRRADGLAVVSRLKRHELENVALQMAETNRQLGHIETERQALIAQLSERGDPDAVEATRVLSDFIRDAFAAVRHEETQATRLREDSAGIQHHLNKLFAEAKRIDVISSRRAEARKQAIDEAETAAQNEAFLVTWQREHGG